MPYAVHRHDVVTSGFIGSGTRWSCDGSEPPPLRPLVRRAPRAGAQAPDQRYLVPALGGDESFSGGFLGALSILRRACHGRVARRVRPRSSGFAAGFSSEPLAHRAARGMPMQRPDQSRAAQSRAASLLVLRGRTASPPARELSPTRTTVPCRQGARESPDLIRAGGPSRQRCACGRADGGWLAGRSARPRSWSPGGQGWRCGRRARA